tara:strand:+ start:1078 stop:2292 length:1215 start_codon:yes stop_codon:yes gene_type:complete
VTGKENNPISVKDARERILKSINPINKTEKIDIKDSLNRILSKSIKAKRTQPAFNTSAMDGYATKKKYLKVIPKFLDIIGETKAGDKNKFKLRKDQAVRVYTGSFLPEGCDKVILQENCERNEDKVHVKEVNTENFIRKKGEDFFQNDQCLLKSSIMDFGNIALAGAMNYKLIEVYRKPRIGIIANGNELFEPGNKNQQMRQPASTKPSIISSINAWGGDAVDLGIAKDTVNSLKSKLKKGLSCDMIVTIGGASVGDYDLVYKSLKEMNFKLNFWKIKMKPGKPLMFGYLKNKPIIGLPGNPISSMVCAQLFLKQSIYKLQNHNYSENIFNFRLGKDLPKNNWRESYLRGYISKNTNDQTVVMPITNQDSSSISSYAKADLLIIREPNAKKIKKNSLVKAIILN